MTKTLVHYNFLRKKGYNIVLLSGTFDFILKPLASFLKADCYYGTSLDIKNKMITGQIRNDLMGGDNKYNKLKDSFPENFVSWKDCFFYSDDMIDSKLFNFFPNSFYVKHEDNRNYLINRYVKK